MKILLRVLALGGDEDASTHDVVVWFKDTLSTVHAMARFAAINADTIHPKSRELLPSLEDRVHDDLSSLGQHLDGETFVITEIKKVAERGVPKDIRCDTRAIQHVAMSRKQPNYRCGQIISINGKPLTS